MNSSSNTVLHPEVMPNETQPLQEIATTINQLKETIKETNFDGVVTVIAIILTPNK